MREADALAVREVLASGLLDSSAREAAGASLARIARTLRTRRLLYRLIGPPATERLIARVRGRRS